MGFFADFRRNRRRSKAWDEAYSFIRVGNFAAAASVYERLAADSVQHNELIYESDCHDAFKMWLKAMNVDNALTQARNALRVISASDWLSSSSDTVDDLCKMVGELYVAGYATAADAFSSEINEQLVAHDLPARSQIKHGKFPTTCPQCGGSLPSTYSDESLTCPFCSCIIHAQ
jgi:hypothetical protein